MCPEAEITEEIGVVIVCFGLPGILSPIFWPQHSNSLIRNRPAPLPCCFARIVCYALPSTAAQQLSLWLWNLPLNKQRTGASWATGKWERSVVLTGSRTVLTGVAKHVSRVGESKSQPVGCWVSYHEEAGDENFLGVTEKVGDGCGGERVSADTEVKGLKGQSVGCIANVDENHTWGWQVRGPRHWMCTRFQSLWWVRVALMLADARVIETKGLHYSPRRWGFLKRAEESVQKWPWEATRTHSLFTW